MNLVGNAMDSMRLEGGRLLVRCVESRDWKTGERGVRVSIADTGHGMEAKTMACVFEPFFTTKENTGTGLGLWIALEIVQKPSWSSRAD